MMNSIYTRLILIGVFFLTCTLSYGQRIVTSVDKITHLRMLKDGVLFIRLSEQSNKMDALNKRGNSAEAASLKKETDEMNALIVKTFNEVYTFSKVHYIAPETTKEIVNDRSSLVTDIVTGEKIDLTGEGEIYFTDFGYGNPTDGFERYNRKGFQILGLENGKVVNLGRDIFYAGVKRGFFVGSFEKNLVKTIQKLNRRLASGSRYLSN